MTAVPAAAGMANPLAPSVSPMNVPDETLMVDVEATGNVLLGEPAQLTLRARNTTSTNEYNLSFRYVLPAGVDYVAGSSDERFGEPEVRTGPDGETILLWVNVSDLPAEAEQELHFAVTADIDELPVGSTFEYRVAAYTSAAERTVPRFDSEGEYTGGATASGSDTEVQTQVSAISLEKSEPSPEHELVRGVHAHPTTYTLTVRNNQHYANEDVVLVDYLPAQLEFLGCGDADNTSGDAVEYDGAARLDAIADLPAAECPTPVSVTTVENPEDYPAGIYTRVEWHLADLAPGEVTEVKYAAAIPQRANTMDFGDETPTSESLGQAANLDNNTGPSTRETDTEQALTNYAEVTANYTGEVAPGYSSDVSDTAELTVTAEDLAIQKSVDPTVFTQDGIATYTLNLQTGEYAEASDIVITDVLPDGLCPIGAGIAECDDGDSGVPSVPFADVTQHDDGTTTVVFEAVDMAASGELTITYRARMLSSYREHSAPTVAGDSYTNRVRLVGQTTTLDGVDAPDPGTVTVRDDSRARIDGQTVLLDKRILPNDATGAYECVDDPTAYLNRTDGDDADFTFSEGSRVCFLLEVTFPDGVHTKNPVLTDFLPEGLSYENGRVLPSSNVTAAIEDDLTFRIGDLQDSDRFVNGGSVFRYALSAIVDSPAQPEQVDVEGNLAKLTWTNTEGRVSFLRDRVDFQVPPAPPVTVVKKSSEDTVQAGDTAEFTVTVGNGGGTEHGNAIDIIGPDVWDRLPAGIECADVVGGSISDGGECTDPRDGDHPPFDGNDDRSAIRWQLDETIRIVPGELLTFNYQVTYPATIAADASYTNDVDVASYRSETNIDTLVDHYPADNVDTTVDPEEYDAPPAHDDATVNTPDTAIAKSNETDVDDQTQGSNPPASYVAIGETVTYEVTATLPADATVYNGVVYDPLPAHLRFDGATYEFSDDDGATWTEVDADTAGWNAAEDEARVELPTPHEVDASPDQVRMTISATAIAEGANPTHGTVLTNTARLTTTDQFGEQPTERTATSTVTAVHPNPSPVKVADITEPRATDEVTYTVTARNVNPGDANQMRPTLFDTQLVDCVPAGLELDTESLDASTGTVTVGDGDGCEAGETVIVWDVGDLDWRAPDDLGTDPWPTLTYVVAIDPQAGGGGVYTNTVTQAGTSMAGDVPDERTYSADTTEDVTVPGGALTKSVSPSAAPVGDTVTYTVQAQVPERVNLYDATVIDQLPLGIAPSSVELDSVTWSYTDAVPGEPTRLPETVELTADGRTHGWFLGDISADDRPREVTIVYTAVIAVDEVTNVADIERTNTAHLAWNTTDQVTGDDVPDPTSTFEQETPPDEATVTVQEPNLDIDKAVSNGDPQPGESFTYTVTVTNVNDTNVVTAYGIDVVDTVPSGVRVTGAIDAGGTLSGADADTGGGGTITWTDLGPLEPGESVELTYAAELISPAPTEAQENTVEIAEYTSLPDGGGRTYDGPEDTATVTPAVPELTIVKTLLDDAPAYRGTSVGWQLEVTNVGHATAYEVDVTDTLPADWSYDEDSAQVSVAGGAATGVEPTVAGQLLTWTDLGNLDVGEKIVVQFTATPGSEAAVGSGTEHLNTAATTGKDLPGGEVVTEDEDDASTRIDSADLQITKTAEGTPVAGAPFSWDLTVTNNGGDTAAGPIEVIDTLPRGVTEISAAGTGWDVTITPETSDEAATVVATRAAELPSGDTAPVLTVSATVPDQLSAGTEITNTASVTSPTHDPEEGNDEDPETSEVTTLSDFGIDKRVSGELVPGAPASYTIDVTNHGPSQAHGAITVTDALPAGLSYASFAGDGWSLDSQDGQEVVFRWTGETPVAVGALPQLSITADVASSLTGDVTNTATVHEPTDPTSAPEEPDSDSVTTGPTPSADLAIEKVHVGDLDAGEEGTYRFTVTNHGPSDAAGPVTITDELPSSLTYTGATSTDDWSCAVSGQALTCELAEGLAMAPGGGLGTSTLDITVDIDEALTGDIQNTATVTSPTDDPQPGNNESTDDTGIQVLADLGIVKTLETDPVVAGEDVTYELTVTNHGPATSPGPITVTDALPEGLTFVSASGADWACGEDGEGLVTCDRAGTLAAGVSAPVITVIATVDSGVGTTTLTNTASVDGPAQDPNPGNNTDPEPTPVTEDTEISLTKTTTGANPVRAGENATFEITVENTGSSDARNVIVTDHLEAGMTVVSVSGDGWECDDDTCIRDRIVAGTTAPPLTVVAEVASGTAEGTTLANRAVVTTSTPGDDPTDNEDVADVDVITEADLALTKVHAGEAVAGSATSFELTVTNHGPSDAVGPLTITDTLPAGMSYLSAGAPWDCTPGTDGDIVECELPDGLAAGQSAPVLELRVQLDATLESGPITNTARVDSSTTDPVPGNNPDDEEITVERYADVSVTKSHTGPVRIGDELSFTLEVHNAGPSEARDVVVTDILPEGLTLLAVYGEGWVCDTDSDDVDCAFESVLAPDTDAAPITVTTMVEPAAYPEIVNVARVSTSSPDPNPANDEDHDPVEVPAMADLSIEKSVAGELVVDEPGDFQLAVTNHGPTAAPGPITVSDALPAGLTFERGTGEGWTCEVADDVVTCVVDGPLEVGETVTVTVTTLVGASAFPEVTNSATVIGGGEDPVPGNNTGSVVAPVSQLELEETGGAGGDAAGAGERLPVMGAAVGGLAVLAALLLLAGVLVRARARRTAGR